MPDTAFIVPQGLYAFTRTPMGLNISPSAFNRNMTLLLSDLLYRNLSFYIEDLYVHASTFEQT